MLDRLPDDGGVLITQVLPIGETHVKLVHAGGIGSTTIPRQTLIKVERRCRVDDQDEARIIHTSSSPPRRM